MSREAGQAPSRHLPGAGGPPAPRAACRTPRPREIVAELQSHVLDRVDGLTLSPAKVEAAIAALGTPRRGGADAPSPSGWPPRWRPAARRWAWWRPSPGWPASVWWASSPSSSRSSATLIAGGFLFVAALETDRSGAGRPVARHGHQRRVVLCLLAGLTDHPPGARDLLGWWIVPVGLAVGLAAGYLTWRFGAASVRAMRRGARRPALAI